MSKLFWSGQQDSNLHQPIDITTSDSDRGGQQPPAARPGPGCDSDRPRLVLVASNDNPDQLGQLCQAIVKHTQDELYWLGEVLLSEIEKETGYNGRVTAPPREAVAAKGVTPSAGGTP